MCLYFIITTRHYNSNIHIVKIFNLYVGIRDDKDKRGVIPNSFEHIFDHISQSENQQYLVRASYLEIYQVIMRDI